MLNETSRKYENVLNTKNVRLLTKRLEALQQEELTPLELESESVHIMVKTLHAHGKKSNQTYQISQIAKVLAEALGLDKEFCEMFRIAAMMYDIGNIAITSDIYAKDERLTYEEFEVVKEHTLHGYAILSTLEFPSMQLAAIISLEHHEWWNGGGYPCQLQDEEINIASRIITLADTVGALANLRAGRTKWTLSEVIDYVEKRAGLQFDPEVVDVFLINLDEIAGILSTELEIRN